MYMDLQYEFIHNKQLGHELFVFIFENKFKNESGKF